MKQVKDRRNFGPTRTQRVTSKITGAFVMVGLIIVLAATAFSSTAMAQAEPNDFAFGQTIGTAIFVIGIFLAIVVGLMTRRKDGLDPSKGAGAFAVFGVVALIAIPLLISAFDFFTIPEEVVVAVIPPTGVALEWIVTLEADLDVDGSAIPASPLTNCDTAIGGTTGEWTAADRGNLQNDQLIVTTGVHIDTDLADTDPLWMEPNCIFIEVQEIQLRAGPASSGGALETQFYEMRIDSISVTRLPTDNKTVTQSVFFEDTQGRHHIGYQKEAGNWVEACPEFRSQRIPTSGCAAIQVGQDNGAGDTTGAIGSAGPRIFWVWEDRGPFAWRDNNGAVWTLVFSVGSNDDWHTYTFVATMDKSATDNS